MKRKVIVISILAIIASLSIATVSNAAIQIKPTQANVHLNITPSNAYQYCYDMRNASSSLGVNNLDPHLTLNKDWGAAAYLAISAYGTTRNNEGISVGIDSYGYFSTTGNVTGVMSMGRNETWTASFMEGATERSAMNVIKNNKDTKYVETIPSNDFANKTKGYAFKETESWYYSENDIFTSGYQTYVRKKLLYPKADHGDQNQASKTTFRPVIWNK